MQTFEDTYRICPHCGYMVGTPPEEAIHITPGTLLKERYTIGRALGYGGFGVTYLAWDSRLEQKVAVKEYLPSEFSTRMPGQSQVSVFGGDKAQQFKDGLKQFVDESRRLARFQKEPGIVTVYDSFEENDTAYIVMEYLEGETLTEYLKREGTIDEDMAVAMLTPLMESLKVIHGEGMLHRDIAPDNIFLTTDGQVKLIDFGAARFATTSHSRSLTVIIKPGYSPEEQYRSRGDQGPYTDVYALGAVLYKMLTGLTPPDAMERRAKYENQSLDILKEPHKIRRGISRGREVAILNAMNVRIEDRTPDIETFLKELNADPPAKRIYGKIKKIDIYAWPLWLKILVPALGMIALTLGTLLLTGVIRFDSRYSDEIILPENVVRVPEVEGLSSAEAVARIKEGRLSPVSGGNVQSEYVKVGVIILQTPAPGAFAAVNSPVRVVVSAGTGVIPPFNGVATVPYVIWDSLEEAQAKLKKAGLGEASVEEVYDETVAEGQVILASHEAGEELPEGSVLTLTLSKGPAPFALRSLLGLSKEEAMAVLEESGLVAQIEYKSDSSVPEGEVIAQGSKEGTMVRKGDVVSLTVASSKPTFTVENVAGKEKSEAEKLLKEQGFIVLLLDNYDDIVPEGQVIRQEPEAGSSQVEGSQITVYVSKGKQQRQINPVVEVPTAPALTTAAPTTPALTSTATTTSMHTQSTTTAYVPPTQPAATTAKATTSAPTTAAPTQLPTTAYVPPTQPAATTAKTTEAAPTTPAPTTVPPTQPAATTEKATEANLLDSGKYGDLTWELTKDGVLTIKGNGPIFDYGHSVMWGSYRGDIHKVVIEPGVTSIGASAFYGCERLTSITIPQGVTSIGNGAFAKCRSLTSITIPQGVTHIGSSVFYCCDSLASIIIPQGVTFIGDSAFEWCGSLTSITIPPGVASIGENAFSYCHSLTSITIPQGITSIRATAFNGCGSLTSITIPQGVTVIGNGAFQDCDGLTSITIPQSVTSIGDGAFCRCESLTSITIPQGVTSIGQYAFVECVQLKDVFFEGSKEDWERIRIEDYNDALKQANIHFGK